MQRKYRLKFFSVEISSMSHKNYKPENEHISAVQEDSPSMRFYSSPEAQEEERLKEAVNRTATEKFRVLMTLMKIGAMMKNATVHHKK